MPKKMNLKELTKDEIHAFMSSSGLSRFRADQLIHWIYAKKVSDINEITEFSKGLRNSLRNRSYISGLKLERYLKSTDGTQKFLFSLEDGHTIESVLIPDDNRLTLCVSSQVGCAFSCAFCQTGKSGLSRNLKAYEIVDQILTVQKGIQSGDKISNVVFMGMGEPLANVHEVVEALWRIVSFVGISKRRITLSTVGIAPAIGLLAAHAPEINLAISLNATTDAIRQTIMPVNRRYPLKTVLDACRIFPLRPRRRITFEYILIGGINDSADDARRLVKLLRHFPCKINLIPLNPIADSMMHPPSEKNIEQFQNILVQKQMTAIVRKSKGQDINASCGQLRGSTRRRKTNA